MDKSKPRILILSWEIFPMFAGGLGFLTRSVVDELRRQGAEVTVLVPQIPKGQEIPDIISLEKSTSKYHKRKEIIPNLDFKLDLFHPLNRKLVAKWQPLFSNRKKSAKRYNLYPNKTPGLTRAFAFAVRDWLEGQPKFDIIYGMDWMSIPSFYLLNHSKNPTPFVLYINSTEVDRSPGKMKQHAVKVMYELEKQAFKDISHIVSISNVSQEVLSEFYEVPSEKITVVFNDITFEPKDIGYKDLKKGKNVLFIGRVAAQKGLFFLVETAARVVEVDPQVRFIIAGDGDTIANELPDIIDAVAEKGLEKNVLFTGWVNEEEKKQLYKTSDLFVMPSPSEPFGLTPLEAIRSGVPTISSQTSGFIGVVPSTPTFKYHDTYQFSQLILYYLGNKKAALELLKKQQIDLDNHSWEREVNKLITLVQTLNNKPSEPKL